jgi:hypothetical protein
MLLEIYEPNERDITMFQLSIAASCSRAHSCNVEMSRITQQGRNSYGDGLALGPFSGVSVVAHVRIP